MLLLVSDSSIYCFCLLKTKGQGETKSQSGSKHKRNMVIHVGLTGSCFFCFDQFTGFMFGRSLWSSLLIDLGCHWHVPLLCDHGIGGLEQGGRCRNTVKGGGSEVWIIKRILLIWLQIPGRMYSDTAQRCKSLDDIGLEIGCRSCVKLAPPQWNTSRK